MAGRHTVGGPRKKAESGVRYVIEFEDGTTRSYVSGQARYQAYRQLKEQGREYLVKRQYIVGSVQGIGNYT